MNLEKMVEPDRPKMTIWHEAQALHAG